MGPPRAEMTRIEAELKELEGLGDDDEDMAMAVVAAAAASALASGHELPESHKAMLAAQKQKQADSAHAAEKKAAEETFLTPRSQRDRGRARSSTAGTSGANAKKPAPEKSPADIVKELKIRKMLLAGQLGQVKKQAAAASGDEKAKLEKSLAALERDMATLDEDIKKNDTAVKVLLEIQK